MKRILAVLLALVMLLGCASALAEATTAYHVSIPELDELSVSYEEGSEHWSVKLQIGETEIFSFGMEMINGHPYAVSSLLPYELRMDEASVQQVLSHSSFLNWIVSKFKNEATLPEEAAAPEADLSTEDAEAAQLAEESVESITATIDLTEVQPLHIIAAVTRILSRNPTDTVDEEGRQVRVFTILRKDIQELFNAIAMDLDATDSFHTAMDEILAKTPLSYIGFDSDNLIAVIQTIGYFISGHLTDEIYITTYGDFSQMDAFTKVDLDAALFSQKFHVQLSLNNQTLSQEDHILLKDRYGIDFDDYTNIFAGKIELSSEDETRVLPSLVCGYMQNDSGNTRIIAGITTETEEETRKLLTVIADQKDGAVDSVPCTEYNFSIGSIDGEIFRLRYLVGKEGNLNKLSLIVDGQSYSVVVRSEQYERKAYIPTNPINPGALSEEAYLKWVNDVQGTIIKNLFFSLLKIPLEVIDLSGLISSLLK